jgi:hypothetical protein
MRLAAILSLLTLALPMAHADEPKPVVPTSSYEKRTVEGWTVHVNKDLLAESSELGKPALRLLETKLYEITRVIPPAALRKLQEVPIWLGVDDGHAPCAEYHPSRDWLRANGYNPDKAKGVEIGNAARFLKWSNSQPMMIFHELSHAYHDRVLGYGHAGIKAAYENAVKTGLYKSVLRNNGKTEKAYALSNEQEYFAEASEAFYGTNDFFPFVRAELERHDPTLYALLKEVWGRDS